MSKKTLAHPVPVAKPRTLPPRAGQVYKVPRRGKPARHVRLTRVRGLRGKQPKATYIQVTKSGRKKSPTVNTTWLTWAGEKWSLPANWVLCS